MAKPESIIYFSIQDKKTWVEEIEKKMTEEEKFVRERERERERGEDDRKEDTMEKKKKKKKKKQSKNC